MSIIQMFDQQTYRAQLAIIKGIKKFCDLNPGSKKAQDLLDYIQARVKQYDQAAKNTKN